MVKRYFEICVIFAVFSMPLNGHAQTIVALEDTVALWSNSADSLLQIQIGLQDSVQRLAAVVDSLKHANRSDRATGPLEAALRQSVRLALALEATYAQQSTIEKVLASSWEELRDVYDREIGTIIGDLADEPDVSKIRQLKDYQQARKRLVENLVSQRQKTELPVVAIGPEDNPEAIRQKAAFMADVAAQIRRDLASADSRLVRLRNEERLRNRAQTLLTEISLFDDGAPVGRSLHIEKQEIVSNSRDGNTSASQEEISESVPPSAGIVGDRFPGQIESVVPDLSQNVLALGLEVEVRDTQHGDAMSTVEGLALEIQQLQRQRVLLEDQAKQATARAEALRLYLEQMLGGTR